MDDKLILEKIAQLQKEVEKQNKKFHGAAIRTGIIMFLLVVLVFAYTTFLYKKISELATPRNMAVLLIEQGRAQLPAVRSMIREQMAPRAGELAQKGVDSIASMIPTVGQYSRNMISQTIDAQFKDMSAKLIPELEQVLDKTVKVALTEKNTGAVSEATAQQIGEAASAEVRKIINAEFYQSVANFEDQLALLKNKKSQELTRRERSERMAIAAMLRLAEEAQNDPTPVTSMADVANEITKSLNTEIPQE